MIPPALVQPDCGKGEHHTIGFVKEPVSGGGNLRPAKLADALEVLAEANRHHLVTRPFTGGAGKVKGMCICCDCHCDYFHNPDLAGTCAPGRLVAVSDEATCDGCGVCVPVCHFGARSKEGALVDSARYTGCGLCVAVCPAGAATMEKREAAQA